MGPTDHGSYLLWVLLIMGPTWPGRLCVALTWPGQDGSVWLCAGLARSALCGSDLAWPGWLCVALCWPGLCVVSRQSRPM